MKVTGVPVRGDRPRAAAASGPPRGRWRRRATTRCSPRRATLAREMLAHGTTTFECKSGYGLSRGGRAAGARAGRRGSTARSPRRTDVDRAARPRGARRLRRRRLDGRGRRRSSRRVAATGARARSTSTSSRSPSPTTTCARMGELAAAHGLDLRAHVEQFNAEPLGAGRARGRRALRRPPLAACIPTTSRRSPPPSCAAVLLPGAEVHGRRAHAARARARRRGRDLRAGHGRQPRHLARSSRMPLIVGLAVRRYGWSVREALLAATLNAAWVLRRSAETGSLEVGKRADVLLLDGPIEHVPYRLRPQPGRAVASRRRRAARGCGPTRRGGVTRGDRGARTSRRRLARARRHRRATRTASRGWPGRRRTPPAARWFAEQAARARPARRARPGGQPVGAARTATGPWWGVGSHLDTVRARRALRRAARRRRGLRGRRARPCPVAVARLRRRGGRALQHADVRQPGARRPARRRRRARARRRRRRRRSRDALAAAGVDPDGARRARRPGSAACAASSSCTSTRRRDLERAGRAGRRGRPAWPRRCGCRPTCTAAPTTPARRAGTSAATRCRPPPA